MKRRYIIRLLNNTCCSATGCCLASLLTYLVTPLTVPSNFVSTHQSCYPQHCMWNVEVNGEPRVSATPWMCSTVDVPEDPGTVLARSCHQRAVDEKIWDASPIRDSANPEAEIDRSRNTIAWTCSCDLDTRIWWKNQRTTTENMADVI